MLLTPRARKDVYKRQDKKRISLAMKARLNEAPAEEAEEEGGEE